MSKFYVGQRVRIRWCLSWPELAGAEGVIVGRKTCTDLKTWKLMDWEVAPDAWGDSSAPGSCGRYFAPSSDQLEPLQPERNQTIAWSECVWKPEHMRAEA
jgi:hypothetical protein